MRLIEIAKMSAEGVLREWEKWEEEAGGRTQDAQDPRVCVDLMIEFLSAEIEEQMTVAFNRGYKAAEEIVGIVNAMSQGARVEDEAFTQSILNLLHDRKTDESDKEFCK